MLKVLARRLRRSEEGFTLIELLVVVAIIALLATFAVPKLFDAINKSKQAPGQADMQTISGALDRFYMDSTTSNYPKNPGVSQTVAADLTTNGYLKATTSFLNGFKKGYLYFSDASGSYYVLVDPANNSGAITVECGTGTEIWTGNLTPDSSGLKVGTLTKKTGYTGAETAPTGAQLAKCAVTSPANAAGVQVITN